MRVHKLNVRILGEERPRKKADDKFAVKPSKPKNDEDDVPETEIDKDLLAHDGHHEHQLVDGIDQLRDEWFHNEGKKAHSLKSNQIKNEWQSSWSTIKFMILLCKIISLLVDQLDCQAFLT